MAAVGFSGAASQDNSAKRNNGGRNGLAGTASNYPAGAGYFEASQNTNVSSWSGYVRGGVGGGAGYYTSWYGSTNGGAGGAGGNVYVKTSLKSIHAYNGSYITTSDSGSSDNPWGKYQCPIYAQLGINSADLRTDNIVSVTGRTAHVLQTELSKYLNGMKKLEYNNTQAITQGNASLGIGSGAGYIEKSNGTITITE